MVGTIGSLGHIRAWICLGSGHPFAKGNSRSSGTCKVQTSTRQAAGRPVLPVSLEGLSLCLLVKKKSGDVI